MSGSLKPDLFYSNKLHLVEKWNLILAKSIYISVKSHNGSRNKYQLSKTYKSVTAFSLNNADFPTLTPLSPRKTVSDCISVSLCKSVHNSFIKPVQKPYISSIKSLHLVVRKCSVYKFRSLILVNALLMSVIKCSKLFIKSFYQCSFFSTC